MWNLDKGALVGACIGLVLFGVEGRATEFGQGLGAEPWDETEIEAWLANGHPPNGNLPTAAGDDTGWTMLQRLIVKDVIDDRTGFVEALLCAGGDADHANGQASPRAMLHADPGAGRERRTSAGWLEAKRLIPLSVGSSGASCTEPSKTVPSDRAIYDALMDSDYAKAGALIENSTPDQLNFAEAIGTIDGKDIRMSPLLLSIWRPRTGHAERRAILDKLLDRPGLRCEGGGDYAPLTYFARHHPGDPVPAKLTEICEGIASASASASLDGEIAALYVAISADYYGGMMQRVDLAADPNANGLVHFSTKTSTIEVECLDDRGCRGFFEKDFRLMCDDAGTGRYALERDIDAGVHPAASIVATKASRQGWVWAGFDARSTLPETPSKARDYHPLACEIFGFGRFEASVRTTIDP